MIMPRACEFQPKKRRRNAINYNEINLNSYLPLPFVEGRGKEAAEPRFITLLFVIMETLDNDLDTALPE